MEAERRPIVVALDRTLLQSVAGMRETRLTRYPGSAVGWQNHVLPATTAFVVELPPGRVSHALSERLLGALHAIAAG